MIIFNFKGLVDEEFQDGAFWSLAEMPPNLIIRLIFNFIQVFLSTWFRGLLDVMLVSILIDFPFQKP